MTPFGKKVVLGALLAGLGAGLSVQAILLWKFDQRLDALEAPPRATATSLTPPAASTPPRDGDPLASTPRPRAHRSFDPFDLLGDWPFADPFLADFSPWGFGPGSGLRDAPSERLTLEDRATHYELQIPLHEGDGEVEVSVERGVLRVASSHASEDEHRGAGAGLGQVRRYGSFEQRLSLPADAEGRALRTEEHGDVLRVIIPKRV